jgi:hypothetical protein
LNLFSPIIAGYCSIFDIRHSMYLSFSPNDAIYVKKTWLMPSCGLDA